MKPLPKDRNQLAYEIVRMSTEEAEPVQEEPKPDERSPISKYLSEIGRKGGLKGGKARAEKLSPERRKEIARKAVESRWSKDKHKPQ
jgi:general stress protein YciG